MPEGYSTLVGGGIVAVLFLLALWLMPRWKAASMENLSPTEKFSIENEARKTLAQIIGGIFVLFGLIVPALNLRVTQENAQTTQKLTEKGQVTERFTQAITQLGDEHLEVRLGGIYALEKIAKDYPDDYHWTVMEILAAFVREKAPNKSTSSSNNQIASQKSLPGSNRSSKKTPVDFKSDSIVNIKPSQDIQAILTVIGRRALEWGKEGEKKRGEEENQILDFSNTDLRGIKLESAKLRRAKLSGADLRTAELSGKADLRGAELIKTDLRGAELIEADLSDAKLSLADLRSRNTNLAGAILIKATVKQANLRETNLYNAKLIGVILDVKDLSGAILSEADLSGADLSMCETVTWEQINSAAVIDEHTQVPPRFEAQKQEKLRRQREGK